VALKAKTILIVDDENKLCELLSDFLQGEGYQTLLANDGLEAIDVLFGKEEGNQPPGVDLVILDVMMPGMDGLEVCQMVRQHSRVPILFLTARDQPYDEVEGLGLGADDYVAKPFHLEVLLARVKALLRRNEGGGEGKVETREPLVCGELVLDFSSHQVLVSGKEIPLSPREFELLELLVENRGYALSREQILERVWGLDFEGDERVVDTHIKNIRLKLGEYKSRIVTVRSLGYRFEGE